MKREDMPEIVMIGVATFVVLGATAAAFAVYCWMLMRDVSATLTSVVQPLI